MKSLCLKTIETIVMLKKTLSMLLLQYIDSLMYCFIPKAKKIVVFQVPRQKKTGSVGRLYAS